MKNIFNKYERNHFLNQLSEYSTIFNAVYRLGNAVYSDSVDTACVMKKDGILFYLINYNFFCSLNEKEKLFVVCHESLHVFFNHLHDIEVKNLNVKIANIAMDIVINEILINHFNFNLEELPIANKKNKNGCICLIDTVFNKEQIIKYDISLTKGYQYLYDCIIKEFGNDNPKFEQYISIDNHQPDIEKINKEFKDFLIDDNSIILSSDENNNGEDEGSQDDILNNYDNGNLDKTKNNSVEECNTANNNMPSNESQFEDIDGDFISSLKDIIDYETGKNLERLSDIFDNKGFSEMENKNGFELDDYLNIDFKVFRKKDDDKWKKLVKFVNPSLLEKKETIENSFGMPNYSIGLILEEQNIILPGLKNDEVFKKERINLYFFFDVSGSCIEYKDIFLDIVSKIPTKLFRLNLFVFSTFVLPIEIDYKNKKFLTDIKTGYGTNFKIIEEQIQSDLNSKKIKSYPEFVCVLTDGIANPINNIPKEKEKNWLWLLTTSKHLKKNQKKYNESLISLFNYIKKKNIIPFEDDGFNILEPKINKNIKTGCKIYPIDRLINSS